MHKYFNGMFWVEAVPGSEPDPEIIIQLENDGKILYGFSAKTVKSEDNLNSWQEYQVTPEGDLIIEMVKGEDGSWKYDNRKSYSMQMVRKPDLDVWN